MVTVIVPIPFHRIPKDQANSEDYLRHLELQSLVESLSALKNENVDRTVFDYVGTEHIACALFVLFRAISFDVSTSMKSFARYNDLMSIIAEN